MTHTPTFASAVFAGAFFLAALTACSANESVTPSQSDALRAVDAFTRLADSVSRAGDPGTASAYASLAEAVRQGGRVSPVSITLDGVAVPFLATAQQTEVTLGGCVGVVCLPSAATLTLRSLVAWQQDDPRRVVQLSSESNADSIRAFALPTGLTVPAHPASLLFLDGKGGAYSGTSGTQSIGVTTSDTPCLPSGGGPIPAIFPAPPRCTQAAFAVSLNATTEPSSLPVSRNTATGRHTISMTSQTVLGARIQLTALQAPVPPIVLAPAGALSATLAATVDSGVTLTLTVRNTAGTPAQVSFASGQHADFTVTDINTGAVVWRWGMGMLFTQVASVETVPPNGTLVYSARWTPAQKGKFVATGRLVSQSHQALASVPLTVP